MVSEEPTAPWRENKHWQSRRILSSAQHAHWVMWGFALFWNLVSLPLAWQAPDILDEARREPLTLVALLFPLVGIILLVTAALLTRQRYHFGTTPLYMDPFPGNLGGHVGGTVESGIPYRAGQRFQVSLSCVYSHRSGSGKNRGRKESILWQNQGVAHTSPSATGTSIHFRFDTPPGQPASSARTSGNFYRWRVRVWASLEGPDFDRYFDIPVFPTGQHSGLEHATESHADTVDAAMEGIRSIADIQTVPGGIEAFFPAAQRPAQGIAGLACGAVFLGAGGFAASRGNALFVSIMCCSIGALVAGIGIYYLGKSLRVRIDREGIRTRRFLFGYPLKTRNLPRERIRELSIKEGSTMQSGNKTTVFYQLYAGGEKKTRLIVAERLTSRPEAELLLESYRSYLGLGIPADSN